jgi:hypothetical protein
MVTASAARRAKNGSFNRRPPLSRHAAYPTGRLFTGDPVNQRLAVPLPRLCAAPGRNETRPGAPTGHRVMAVAVGAQQIAVTTTAAGPRIFIRYWTRS